MSFVDISCVYFSIIRMQSFDQCLRASVDDRFIHGWGTIIYVCELSMNGLQHNWIREISEKKK